MRNIKCSINFEYFRDIYYLVLIVLCNIKMYNYAMLLRCNTYIILNLIMQEILHLKITKCFYQYYTAMYSKFFQKKIYINFDLSIIKVFWIARHILTNEKKLVKKLKLLKRDPKLWSIERMTFYRI